MSLERRASYRIIYPTEARPVFAIDGVDYAVLDASEHGLRLAAGPPTELAPQLGDDVLGTVRFRSGAEVHIEGTVVRATSEEIALRLTARLPFAAILAEQRYLRSRFPGWGRGESE